MKSCMHISAQTCQTVKLATYSIAPIIEVSDIYQMRGVPQQCGLQNFGKVQFLPRKVQIFNISMQIFSIYNFSPNDANFFEVWYFCPKICII